MTTVLGKLGRPVSDYDAYGFDIDHTLAMYNLPELFRVFSQCLMKDLIHRKPDIYEESLLEREFDLDFCAMRGVIYDINRGNFFKVASDGRVLHASHGTRSVLKWRFLFPGGTAVDLFIYLGVFTSLSALSRSYPDRPSCRQRKPVHTVGQGSVL